MGIENVFKYLEIIVTILPLVDKIISFVESIFVRMGILKAGVIKKEVTLKAITRLIPDVPQEILSETIDLIVDIKNSSGEFITSKETENSIERPFEGA